MRIGVLRTQVPFVTGGAERHAANLVHALNAYGHEATEITLPFKWYPAQVLADHILGARLHDVSNYEGVPVDLAIGLKFPAWYAQHPNKLFWIIHQHRQAYDMWTSGQSDLLDDPDGDAARQLIHLEDRAAFEASQHPLYANSGNVAQRLKTHLGMDATPLYHPPPNAERIRQGGYGDYLFAPGRINPSKRLELMIEALATTSPNVRLVIAGVAENPDYQTRLRALAKAQGVADRITWLGRVDDDTLLRTYAEARAVVFVPQDEDYGYISLEAMLAGKPVLTVTDAGGPLEFIRDRQEGLVTAPTATDLGHAFTRAMDDAALAERLGQAGHARFQSMNITWEHVVETLAGSSRAAVDPVPPPDPTPAIPDSAPVMSPQEQAMAALAKAVAPPSPPKGLPFDSIGAVLDAYAFDELPAAMGRPKPPADPGLASYLGTHWTRFTTTLALLQDLDVNTALDVGVFPPLVFQALLANQHKGVEMAGLWEGPNPYAQSVQAADPAHPGFDIRLEPANSERDLWPYEGGSFDLVTGMEILEHLALDPYFFFAEANRVLKPGGHLLLSTPNVTSHRGVSKMLKGIAPYSFGIFVPSGGVYGRHNREYAPQDLADLGQAAGFEVVALRTIDVYDRYIDADAAQLLADRDDDLSMRGETIFYLARKAGTPEGLPERFYHGDPRRMSGALSVAATEAATGLTRITVANHSPEWWAPTGTHATCLLAEWIDADGDLRHQHLCQPLREPIGPENSAEIRLTLDPENTTPDGTLRLHLYQAGVGVMTGLGRAPTLSLPCSHAAFLHLAQTYPAPGET